MSNVQIIFFPDTWVSQAGLDICLMGISTESLNFISNDSEQLKKKAQR